MDRLAVARASEHAGGEGRGAAPRRGFRGPGAAVAVRGPPGAPPLPQHPCQVGHASADFQPLPRPLRLHCPPDLLGALPPDSGQGRRGQLPAPTPRAPQPLEHDHGLGARLLLDAAHAAHRRRRAPTILRRRLAAAFERAPILPAHRRRGRGVSDGVGGGQRRPKRVWRARSGEQHFDGVPVRVGRVSARRRAPRAECRRVPEQLGVARGSPVGL
mmetsp:Transcript_9604/g.22777  ORF Transcript_9604/g.22777 Transcript_9604/m.22777 type:complete len:215 (+) Transcript_9604:179-823(+)